MARIARVPNRGLLERLGNADIIYCVNFCSWVRACVAIVIAFVIAMALHILDEVAPKSAICYTHVPLLFLLYVGGTFGSLFFFNRYAANFVYTVDAYYHFHRNKISGVDLTELNNFRPVVVRSKPHNSDRENNSGHNGQGTGQENEPLMNHSQRNYNTQPAQRAQPGQLAQPAQPAQPARDANEQGETVSTTGAEYEMHQYVYTYGRTHYTYLRCYAFALRLIAGLTFFVSVVYFFCVIPAVFSDIEVASTPPQDIANNTPPPGAESKRCSDKVGKINSDDESCSGQLAGPADKDSSVIDGRKESPSWPTMGFRAIAVYLQLSPASFKTCLQWTLEAILIHGGLSFLAGAGTCWWHFKSLCFHDLSSYLIDHKDEEMPKWHPKYAGFW